MEDFEKADDEEQTQADRLTSQTLVLSEMRKLASLGGSEVEDILTQTPYSVKRL